MERQENAGCSSSPCLFEIRILFRLKANFSLVALLVLPYNNIRLIVVDGHKIPEKGKDSFNLSV